MKYSFGLLGYPLLHSLSPRLHGAALADMHLQGEYRLYAIPPDADGMQTMKRILAEMRAGEVHGLNVTIPHKQTVIEFLDDLSPTAAAIGAVNTILLDSGRLIGDNTDAPGFLADLEQVFPKSRELTNDQQNTPPQALVLGAGGAARAVVYALAQTGWKVMIAARRPAQAEQLAAELKPAVGELWAVPLEDHALRDYCTLARLVVNATSAGMLPDVESCPWPTGLPFPPAAFVYDLVYKPAQTTLLRRARANGLQSANGLGMLIEQAALALERWTGLPVPRQAMRRAVDGPAASPASQDISLQTND
jgi:shikimate dehydrogenase